MIVDTSAIVAILTAEPERTEFEELVASNTCSVSSVSYLETSIVLLNKLGVEAVAEMDAWIETADVTIVPFTQTQARLARNAYIAYGKGRHPAALNFGGCASYALAADRNEPLLYKGADFARAHIARIS